jgi:hypothetical protein
LNARKVFERAEDGAFADAGGPRYLAGGDRRAVLGDQRQDRTHDHLSAVFRAHCRRFLPGG